MPVAIILPEKPIFALTVSLTYFPGPTADVGQIVHLRKRYSAGLNWGFYYFIFCTLFPSIHCT